MATIPTSTPSATGSALPMTAAAGGGDAFANSGRENVVVTNGGGAPITVTIAQKKTCEFGGVSPTHDKTFTIPAGATRYLPTLPPELYADPTTGLTSIAYSGVGSVTVGVMKAQ